MATRKQKQELIDTLKFTPIKARILIQGYGGECYIGSVDRETYDFFKSKKIDVEQYVNDWDGELFPDVPEEHRFVTGGSPYECDNLFHASGATMDDSSYITVTNDDTGEDLFETNLDLSNLEDQGITVHDGENFDSDDLDAGSVIFWGGQGEKGCFFDGEITLTAPFDPKKLKITYGNGDGWYLCNGVEYDGEEVEGYDGYSTTGKWGEHKFWIAGDEEVYAGEEREEDAHQDETEDEQTVIDAMPDLPRSDWFDKNIKPVHKGQYEVLVDAPWPAGGLARADWNGRTWRQDDQKIKISQWRGLTENWK